MRNWLVQFLVDVGLVRPRDEVEGASRAEAGGTARPDITSSPADTDKPSDRRLP